MKNQNSIEIKLKSADLTSQKHFCFSVCQRLKENYKIFSEENNFGSLLIFEEILALINTENVLLDIESIEKQIDNICPDMDDFAGNLSASLALDACAVLSEFLFFVLSKDLKHLKNISYIAFQSTEFKILNLENWTQNAVDIAQKIKKHSFFEQELAFQENCFVK